MQLELTTNGFTGATTSITLNGEKLNLVRSVSIEIEGNYLIAVMAGFADNGKGSPMIRENELVIFTRKFQITGGSLNLEVEELTNPPENIYPALEQ